MLSTGLAHLNSLSSMYDQTFFEMIGRSLQWRHRGSTHFMKIILFDFLSMCLQANQSSFTITLDARRAFKGPDTI